MIKNILYACTTYTVNLLKINEEIREEIEQSWGKLDADCTEITMTLNDIDDFEIPSDVVDYDSFDFDEEELQYILEDLIGNHPHYLVFASNCTWNGVSGYKFCTNIIDTCARNYDISLTLKEKGTNAILCTEYSHDVPTGSPTYIIGLSNKEYNKLENADFSEVENFAKSKF